MSNLEFAKQLEKRIQRQVRELERSLLVATMAGITVKRGVSEVNPNQDFPKFERIFVTLTVRPGYIDASPLEPLAPRAKMVWRNNRTNKVIFSNSVFEDENSRKHRRECTLINAHPDVFTYFEDDEQ